VRFDFSDEYAIWIAVVPDQLWREPRAARFGMRNYRQPTVLISPYSAISGLARSMEEQGRRRPGPDREAAKQPFDARQWAAVRPIAESLASIKASQLVGKAGLKVTDQDDIKQRLLLYVIEHLHAHDQSRGIPAAFVAMLITTAVAMLLRERRSIKRGGRKLTLSLDAITKDDRTLNDHITLATSWRRLGVVRPDERQMIDVRVDIAGAIQAVPEHLLPLVDQLAKGETIAAVARKTGRSRRRVFRDLDALRAHLEPFGLHEP